MTASHPRATDCAFAHHSWCSPGVGSACFSISRVRVTWPSNQFERSARSRRVDRRTDGHDAEKPRRRAASTKCSNWMERSDQAKLSAPACGQLTRRQRATGDVFGQQDCSDASRALLADRSAEGASLGCDQACTRVALTRRPRSGDQWCRQRLLQHRVRAPCRLSSRVRGAVLSHADWDASGMGTN
jgi:hypothetical protein